MDIGERLKKYRKHNGLTQEQVAEKIYVSRATISSWETNRTFPDIEKIIYLSDLYDISLDKLLKEEPSIMENVKKERKKLKHYKLIKLLLYVIIGLFISYTAFWFITVYPKNQRLSTWEHTASNNYLKQNGYTFQAHEQKILEPLHNGNIPISTYRGSTFDITIDGNKVYANLYGGLQRSNPSVAKDVAVSYELDRHNLDSSIKNILQSKERPNQAKQLLQDYKTELENDISATQKVWNMINTGK